MDRRAKLKVLIVDDEKNNLALLNDILESHYSLSFATNGNTALELAREHTPDLILLDIMMPGMDGYTLLQKLRQWDILWRTRVIVCSGLGAVNDKLKAFKLGADDFIAKPFNKDELLARVAARLDQPTVLELAGTAEKLLQMSLKKLHKVQGVETNDGLRSLENHLEQLRIYFKLKKANFKLDLIDVKLLIQEAVANVEGNVTVDLARFQIENKHIAGEKFWLLNMVQIILNYVGKYSKSTPVVKLQVIENPGPPPRFVFKVSDKGLKLPAGSEMQLFDPLADECHLGLALAGMIAEKHNGQVRCRSDEWGTTIDIFLPVKQ